MKEHDLRMANFTTFGTDRPDHGLRLSVQTEREIKAQNDRLGIYKTFDGYANRDRKPVERDLSPRRIRAASKHPHR